MTSIPSSLPSLAVQAGDHLPTSPEDRSIAAGLLPASLLTPTRFPRDRQQTRGPRRRLPMLQGAWPAFSPQELRKGLAHRLASEGRQDLPRPAEGCDAADEDGQHRKLGGAVAGVVGEFSRVALEWPESDWSFPLRLFRIRLRECAHWYVGWCGDQCICQLQTRSPGNQTRTRKA